MIVGALYALALISIASIGLLVLPVAVLGTLIVARVPSTLRGLPGLLAGAGVPALFVGFLNRSGPSSGGCIQISGGESCTSSGVSGSLHNMSQVLDPWPWLAAGVCLIAVGVAVFLLSSDS